jgi:membrane-anchored mycosin MYCP
MRSLSRAAALAVLTASLCLPAPAAHADDIPCDRNRPDASSPPGPTEDPGVVSGALQLERAHEIATGRGVGVAVVDSGYDGGGLVDVRGGRTVAGRGPVLDAHGTQVAGLVAGKAPLSGVAPGAHVVPFRVLDLGEGVTPPDDGQYTGLLSTNVAAAIDAAVAAPADLNIRVINLSLALNDEDPAVTRAIQRAIRQGIVVVAAVGNRPVDPETREVAPSNAYRVGEQRVQFPAALDPVLGVTALGPSGAVDPDAVWTGADVDVSAPVVDGLTVTLGGSTCLVADVATSWATASVSGLAALLLEQDPGLTPAQVVTRIEATARGAVEDSALDGHGMVQPVEALTARLDIARNGELKRAPEYAVPEQEISPPPQRADALAESRRDMLWWGIGAGGALLLGLLLRPLTVRLRR